MEETKHVPPTTGEKLQIFNKALEYVKANGSRRCICLAVGTAQEDLGFVNPYDYPLWKTDVKYWWNENNMEDNFPELFKRKPKSVTYLGHAWWAQPKNNPSKKRLAAIEDIIAELKEKLTNNL